MTLRVVHCGTGNVGGAGLQGILHHRDLELNFGAETGGPKITAMPAINGIPAVCAVEPGLKGPLDIPRYHTRNARRP